MPKLDITGELTVEEIHKIREYNHEITKEMSFEDRTAYYNKCAERVLNLIDSLKNNDSDNTVTA